MSLVRPGCGSWKKLCLMKNCGQFDCSMTQLAMWKLFNKCPGHTNETSQKPKVVHLLSLATANLETWTWLGDFVLDFLDSKNTNAQELQAGGLNNIAWPLFWHVNAADCNSLCQSMAFWATASRGFSRCKHCHFWSQPVPAFHSVCDVVFPVRMLELVKLLWHRFLMESQWQHVSLHLFRVCLRMLLAAADPFFWLRTTYSPSIRKQRGKKNSCRAPSCTFIPHHHSINNTSWPCPQQTKQEPLLQLVFLFSFPQRLYQFLYLKKTDQPGETEARLSLIAEIHRFKHLLRHQERKDEKLLCFASCP